MSRCARSRTRVAFTLIELLVVIAIIAILTAILFPVFAQARDKARQSACLSNLKQLGLGFMQYVQDYDETYPGQLPYTPAVNGGTVPYVPYDQLVAPYVRNERVYQCPGDDNYDRLPASSMGFWDGAYQARAALRSYQYVGMIYTAEANGADVNTGIAGPVWSMQGRALADVDATSETVLLVEGWTKNPASASYLGSYSSSAFVGCDVWKLAGRRVNSAAPEDSLPVACGGGLSGLAPTPGHAGGGNYAFADGSAKWLPWGKVRRNDFYLFKLRKPAATFSP